ncbi:MAG: DNA methyltransferase [Trueperaceae bacterium]
MPDQQAPVQDFIGRWSRSEASERANYTLFLSELCDLLELPHPDPSTADDGENTYVFERNVPLVHEGGRTTTGRIDLYKRGCLVLEAKQGSSDIVETPLFGLAPAPARRGHGRRGTSAWDEAMQRAKNQAERYARSLPVEEGRPPFLLVVDVGHTIELYSEFSRSGGSYIPYPDPQHHRLYLEDLCKPEVRDLLRQVWSDPLSLDPSLRSARVTRDIAGKLAQLAKSLETAGHEPARVAGFLMRVIFTMFAEDVGLLPARAFKDMLEGLRGNAEHFVEHVEPLWKVMNEGGYSRDLRETLLRFNGGLFANPNAVPINEPQLALLIEAARADWRDVEPAIFGTLLERALDPRERHKLGAHYTPRAYVERLVQPTLIEPLREEWQGVQAAASQHLLKGKPKDAEKEIRRFHERLCSLRVLDPACGSANFLYVSMELLKRLEGEVLEMLEGVTGKAQLRLELQGVSVSPEQFLGLEVNPRAAKIAELVLWLGYLQWHFRTHGNTPPPEPVIRDFKNIECRDAVLAYDAAEPLFGEDGQPVTHWDGQTTKTHAVTGNDVPDESARVPEYRYVNARKATWPDADFVVGNPPFLGSKFMREALGDGYVDAVQLAWPEVPQATDFVLRWWHHAAQLVRSGDAQRFGLITTNSITHTYNRRAIEPHLTAGHDPLAISFAIPDHPWVDESGSADVRIAMTVGVKGPNEGILLTITDEAGTRAAEDSVLAFKRRHGTIHSDLSVGVDTTKARPLRSNEDLCAVGFKTIGAGFQVDEGRAHELGLGRHDGLEKHIKPYLNGRDLAGSRRGIYVIDFYGLSEDAVRTNFPEAYQHLLVDVKPKRMQNRNLKFREKWWVIGHSRPIMRRFTAGLDRYIATIETSKHRCFSFLPIRDAPDSTLVTFGLEDAYELGVLSCRVHVAWALAIGGRLGVGNDPRYNKTRCFDTFPFPAATPDQQACVRDLANQLDAHRKDRLAEHDKLTMTGIYNVLEKLRSCDELTAKDRNIHAQGLVSVLKDLHDQLDRAVLDAYGWQYDLTDEEILERLVALNAERVAEEAQGKVRWLRPAYQNPHETTLQATAGLNTAESASQKLEKRAWPNALPDQARALRAAIGVAGEPLTSNEAAKLFTGARKDRVGEILDTLAGLGQVVKLEDNRYAR